MIRKGGKRKPPAVSKDANHILTKQCELPHDRGLYAFWSR